MLLSINKSFPMICEFLITITQWMFPAVSLLPMVLYHLNRLDAASKRGWYFNLNTQFGIVILDVRAVD